MKHLVNETVEIARRHSTDKELNQYLSLGWIIVESWVVADGGPDRLEKAHFLMGWINRATKPVRECKFFCVNVFSAIDVSGSEGCGRRTRW